MGFINDSMIGLGVTTKPSKFGMREDGVGYDKEEQMAIRKRLAENVLPPKLASLEAFVAANPSGFLVGDNITIADLCLCQVIDWFASGLLDGVPPTILDPCPKLKALLAAVKADPAIAAWDAAQPAGGMATSNYNVA
jgi:glutathione S-transferase